jgi:hypothetical protein
MASCMDRVFDRRRPQYIVGVRSKSSIVPWVPSSGQRNLSLDKGKLSSSLCHCAQSKVQSSRRVHTRLYNQWLPYSKSVVDIPKQGKSPCLSKALDSKMMPVPRQYIVRIRNDIMFPLRR